MVESMFLKGGVFMWPLLISLLITLIITVERILYWLKIKIENNHQIRTSLLTIKQSSLSKLKQPNSDQAACLAFEAIEKSHLTQTQIDNLLKHKQLKHYRFMRLLDVITSVAPLLGILGTIWGIINSFNLAGVVADIEPATAMVGMSEAFITTAFGLIVSLVALFSYNYFQSLSENELMTNDIFLTKLLVKLNSNE
jgi:biopolymer transport protein ExbB